MGPVVVMLSGASSAGKTTLAKALLPLLDPPAVLVEADSAFPTIHAKYDGWDISCIEPDGPRVLLEVETTRWLLAG